MKTKLYYSLIIVALFFIIACKKQAVPKQTGTQGTTGTTGTTGKTDTTKIDTLGVSLAKGFYVVGEIDNVATVMKKGSMPIPIATKVTIAKSIAVLGKDVYVAGGSFSSELQDFLPCYWKNGNISFFTSSYGGLAIGVATLGNDVYVAANMIIGGTHRAFIYKNEIATELGSSSGYTVATGITVKGSDVYISGYYYDFNDNAYHACYWKNGELTSMQGNSSATGITVSDNSDVYLSGSIGQQPAYWKNSVATTLNVNTNNIQLTASAIAVNGNDVYVAGTVRNTLDSTTAVYWKNGMANYIPAGKSLAAITVVGNDIYVAGQKQATRTTETYAGCWKNGTLFTGEALPSVYESILWVQ